MKTAIIERDKLGGVCLNWGCIPTKALLKSADIYEGLNHLGEYGIDVRTKSFNLQEMVDRSRAVAGQLSAGVRHLLNKHKIAVVEGAARLEKALPAPQVSVSMNSGGSRLLTARHVILATGARAREIPAAGLVADGERIWSYREAVTPTALPESLIIIGSGAIGIEFASFYRALGAEVTVIEMLPRILPGEDAEICAAAQKAFEKRGIKFRVAATVSQLRVEESGVSVDFLVGGQVESLAAERAIVAVGISGNVENLGLEALGVKIERSHVVTDRHGATNVPGLYAVGDVAGPPWLAHKASHEGVHCVEHIAGRKDSGLTAPIAGCTYANPQIASVGVTEAQARDMGIEIKIGRFPFRANGKAIAAGETEGFVKTVFDGKTGALLGAHMMGAEVTELIQGFAVAITLEATEEELFGTVFPHPTLSEAMHEASLDAFGRVLHL
jgi:dihydrolipoamide dehydrogenase